MPTTVISPATSALNALSTVLRSTSRNRSASTSHTSSTSRPSKPVCFNDNATPARKPDAYNQTNVRRFDKASNPTARPAADIAPLNNSVFAAYPSSTGAADTTAQIPAAKRAAASPASSRTTIPVDTTNTTPNSIAMTRMEPVLPSDSQSHSRNSTNTPCGRSTKTSR